ncbi:Surface polysaccharide O-acyltransferase, integral membrane enzyme [Muriicola jejuensis]|uniref:Acyltransferase family protein n=1 Tax=Muriicola jejuensis TaxID=504488 RepID=A0A6P0UBL3_9FLAO|nr:acyltransferase family protein [Muriicola jejuensis]NER10002.1 acyltransferase family protein [Muriicola jejuensis]SMP03879.1 Surface polysaccharide O-acyltransferase, integral membrane enzyme [Muriicola jejuensis]
MTHERRYDIDWLRVIAIGFLLIYHIAIIFQPWAMFVGFVRSPELMESLWVPMTALNVWRIPLLFFVSGMGVYFALRKRNWKQLLRERTQRILLPFLFGVVAITPLHMYIFQGFYNMPLSYFPHLGHLWFLGNIFVYVLLLSPFFFYLKMHPEGRLKKGLSILMSNPLGPISVSVFFIAEVMLVKPQLFELYAETWHGFFLGLLAFLFGFLFVYTGKAFWQTMLKWRWAYLGLALLLYGMRYFIFGFNAPGYLMVVESNSWIFALFGLSYRYLNRPSALLRYLSEAAYPVYIIHMFVLYAGAYLILPLEIPVLIKFIGVVLFTGVFCYLIFELLIRRIGILRPLFGLKPKTGKGMSDMIVKVPRSQRMGSLKDGA